MYRTQTKPGSAREAGAKAKSTPVGVDRELYGAEKRTRTSTLLARLY
jgi:hypothetical protein